MENKSCDVGCNVKWYGIIDKEFFEMVKVIFSKYRMLMLYVDQIDQIGLNWTEWTEVDLIDRSGPNRTNLIYFLFFFLYS